MLNALILFFALLRLFFSGSSHLVSNDAQWYGKEYHDHVYQRSMHVIDFRDLLLLRFVLSPKAFNQYTCDCVKDVTE
jgi:hypothetical protein